MENHRFPLCGVVSENHIRYTRSIARGRNPAKMMRVLAKLCCCISVKHRETDKVTQENLEVAVSAVPNSESTSPFARCGMYPSHDIPGLPQLKEKCCDRYFPQVGSKGVTCIACGKFTEVETGLSKPPEAYDMQRTTHADLDDFFPASLLKT